MEAMSKASREKLVKNVNVYKDGVKIRRSEIESGKKLREHNDIELTTLRKEEKLLSEQVKNLGVDKESIDEREKQERAVRKKEAQEEAERKLKEKKAPDSLRAEGNTVDQQPKAGEEIKTSGEAQNGDKPPQVIKAKSAPIAEEIMEDVPAVHLTELQEEPKLDELSNEELGRVIAARWTREDTTVHVPDERQDHETIENQDNEADIDSDIEPEHDFSEDDEYTFDKEEEQAPETPDEPKKLSWWQRFIPGTLKHFYIRKPVNKSEQIRKQYSDATTKLATLQHQISDEWRLRTRGRILFVS